jgi:two-component system, NarL family, sensor kinase
VEVDSSRTGFVPDVPQAGSEVPDESAPGAEPSCPWGDLELLRRRRTRHPRHGDGGSPMDFPREESDPTDPVTARDEASCEGLGARCSMRAVLEAVSPGIALLDGAGHIRFVNEAWRRLARDEGLGLPPDGGGGTSYLAACDAAGARLPIAAELARRIRASIAGRDEEVRLSYASERNDGVRWFLVRVTAFGEGAERRVVVAHADVTELREAESALHELTARLLVAQDEERRRIARELHDGTAPTLVALSLDLARLASGLPVGEQRDLAAGCAALCEQSLRELRTVTFVLHPPVLEQDGLVEALRWLADGFGKRSGISVRLDAAGAPCGRLRPDVELALYRIVQEALTNVIKHSRASRVSVLITRKRDSVAAVVEDDGVGFSPDEARDGGLGLVGMRERIALLDGRLTVESEPERGTTLVAEVPVV